MFLNVPAQVWSAVGSLLASVVAVAIAVHSSSQAKEFQRSEDLAAARRVIITFESGAEGRPAVWRVTNHDASPILEVCAVEAWAQRVGARQVGSGVIKPGGSEVIDLFQTSAQAPDYCYSDRQEDVLLIEYRDVRGQAWQRLGHAEPKRVRGFWESSRAERDSYFPAPTDDT